MAKPRKKDVVEMLSDCLGQVEADFDALFEDESENNHLAGAEWYKRGLWPDQAYAADDRSFALRAKDGTIFIVTVSKPRQ
jgi:hypothetical protein